MSFRWQVMAAVEASRVVAIVRSPSEQEASAAVRALVEGGLRTVEVTMTTPGALRIVEGLRGSDVLVGVGTVLSAGEASSAAGAGAAFVVTPNLDVDVIRSAHRHGLAALVGCATPTEVLDALEAGADAVKLFPAASLGVPFLAAIRSTLPWAPLVPTGGVGTGNAAEWLAAGAVALGVGGSLTRGSADEVRDRAMVLREVVAAAR